MSPDPLSDGQNIGIRMAALESMVSIDPERSRDTVLSFVNSPSLDASIIASQTQDAVDSALTLKNLAFRSLASVGGEAAHAAIIEGTADADERIRRICAEQLTCVSREKAVPLLVRLAADHESSVQIGAISAMAAIGDPRFVEVLTPKLQDSDLSMRIAAIEALGATSDVRAVTPLIVTACDALTGVTTVDGVKREQYWSVDYDLRRMVRTSIDSSLTQLPRQMLIDGLCHVLSKRGALGHIDARLARVEAIERLETLSPPKAISYLLKLFTFQEGAHKLLDYPFREMKSAFRTMEAILAGHATSIPTDYLHAISSLPPVSFSSERRQKDFDGDWINVVDNCDNAAIRQTASGELEERKNAPLFVFSCSCKQRYSVRALQTGKTVKCAKCNRKLIVPSRPAANDG